uniref:Uncharacterized protein n=1 Tax=viral metagenome TaxID=1070528 RepID=A0A6M3KQQ5_9ZZZZ
MKDRVVYCSTKRFEGDDAVKTSLTLDMSGVTETDLVEYAIDALIIKWQASIRRKKDVEVPTVATYKVPKPGTRAAAVMSPFEMLVIQFGQERADWMVAKFGSAEDAVEALQKQLDEMEAEG